MALCCPNPECRYLRRSGHAATYRAGMTVCADCGAGLVERADGGGATTAAVPSALESSSMPARTPVAPLLVTVAVLAGSFALGAVILPFVDSELLHAWLGRSVDGSLGALQPVSIVAIGITPWISAALLVEIAAAIVPRWRALREPAGRPRLRAAADRLGVVVAFAQAIPLVRWLESLDTYGAPLLTEYGVGARVVIVASLVGGAVLVRLGAHLIDARGMGGGMTLLVALPFVVELARALRGFAEMFREGSRAPGEIVSWLVVIGGAGALTLLVRPLGDDERPPRPVAGVLPMLWSASLLQALWSALPLFNVVAPSSDLHFALTGACAAVLTIGVGRVLHLHAPAFASALPGSLAFVLALVGLSWLAGSIGAPLGVVGIVVVVCVGRDLAAELALWRSHGALSIAVTLPSLAAAQAAATRLANAGIAAHVRAAHHRALWHFFGPHLALDLLVPAGDAERARGLLAEECGA